MTKLVVESPLQAMNAIEFISSQKITSFEIFVIRTKNSRSFYWSLDIIRKFNLNDYLVSVDWEPSKIDNILTALPKLYSLKRKLKCKMLVLGDYKSTNLRFLASKLNYDDLVLLDDGTATINFVNHKSNITDGKSYLKEWLLVNVFGVKRIHDLHPTLFTIYDNLNYHKIIRCNYTTLKIRHQKIDKNKIFVIGSDFVERGTLNLEYYLQAMKTISDSSRNRSIIYIPHRREAVEKQKEISNRFGWKIYELDTIIEIFLLYMDVLPFRIVGISSSALPNIQRIFAGKIEVKFCEINSQLFNVRKKEYQSYYDIFSSDFDIPSLDETICEKL